MAKKTQPAGCRDTALATVLLVSMAAVFTGVGLTLIRGGECTGICETLGLSLLYAGGPVSALIGVIFGDLVLAWPLDATAWVGAGFFAARVAERRGQGPLGVALVLVLVALGYGLVLSTFVEIAVQ